MGQLILIFCNSELWEREVGSQRGPIYRMSQFLRREVFWLQWLCGFSTVLDLTCRDQAIPAEHDGSILSFPMQWHARSWRIQSDRLELLHIHSYSILSRKLVVQVFASHSWRFLHRMSAYYCFLTWNPLHYQLVTVNVALYQEFWKGRKLRNLHPCCFALKIHHLNMRLVESCHNQRLQVRVLGIPG